MVEELSSSRWDLLVLVAIILSPAICVGACLSKAKYDAVVADGRQAHADLIATRRAREAQERVLEQQLSGAEAGAQALQQKLSDLSASEHDLKDELAEDTAINAQLRVELERLGKNVDVMLQEKATMAKALEDTRVRLDELRKAQAAADARAQLFRQFIQMLKG
jgi:hypothetical protein